MERRCSEQLRALLSIHWLPEQMLHHPQRLHFLQKSPETGLPSEVELALHPFPTTCATGSLLTSLAGEVRLLLLQGSVFWTPIHPLIQPVTFLDVACPSQPGGQVTSTLSSSQLESSGTSTWSLYRGRSPLVPCDPWAIARMRLASPLQGLRCDFQHRRDSS